MYYSPAPNYTWHIDGTHKLIRWKFVVHAAIDGYSRVITFCRCSTNNKADTVLELFQEAIERYGLPLRVRTDHGVENVRVWEYMLRARANSNAVVVGSSVHNQRIERLHRDINTQVVNGFYNKFMQLEAEEVLDPANDTDIFCLHLVYLSKINSSLLQFVDASNSHSLSTEGNHTPLQLFTLNLRLLQLHSLDPSSEIDVSDVAFRSNNNVVVSSTANPLTENEFQQVNTLLEGNRHLKPEELYKVLVEFVAELT